MNIDNLFKRPKLTRSEKREKRKRESDRLMFKKDLINVREIFSGDKKKKLELVKKMEPLTSYQMQLAKMKEIYRKDADFFKSKTDLEITGFDKQFKKKKDFLL